MNKKEILKLAYNSCSLDDICKKADISINGNNKKKVKNLLIKENFDFAIFICNRDKLENKISINTQNKSQIFKIADNSVHMKDLLLKLGYKKGGVVETLKNFLINNEYPKIDKFKFMTENYKNKLEINERNKEKILLIASQSKTIKEILEKLHYDYKQSRNRKKLTNFLLLNNFDLSKFYQNEIINLKSQYKNNIKRFTFTNVIEDYGKENLINIVKNELSLGKTLLKIGLTNNKEYRNKLAKYLKQEHLNLTILEEYKNYDLSNLKEKPLIYLSPLQESLEINETNREMIINIASKSASLSHLEKLLGYSNSSYPRIIKLKKLLMQWNFDFSLFKKDNLEKKSNSIFNDKEKLQEAVSQSINFNQVLKFYELSASGDQNKDLKKYLSKYNINISHFSQTSNQKNMFYTNEQIFILNSLVDKNTVRRKILEQNLIPYSCSHCDTGHMWLGKELILDLEHIDGNNKNQQLSNLTFLCPNCHRKTLTWGGRNTKKEHIEPNFIKAHDLLDIIKSKHAYTQVLAHYQDKNNEYNKQKIREYIKNNNIDISHFKFVKKGIKKPLDKTIFSTNSKIESNKIKDMIVKHNLIDYQCLTLNCPTIDDNHPLFSLDLDHINGDNTDNRLENLRFLCPNCHRLTLNWGNKHRE
jgi:5-methylcytosine-specific restriction endonuclease McrA